MINYGGVSVAPDFGSVPWAPHGRDSHREPRFGGVFCFGVINPPQGRSKRPPISNVGGWVVKNIERFNLYAAYIFGMLYEQFPVKRGIDVAQIAIALSLPAQEPQKVHDSLSLEHTLVQHTIDWLVETGCLMRKTRGDGSHLYVLSPKAFEALNAKLSTLEGKQSAAEEKSIGERFSEVAQTAGKEAAREGLRKTVSEMVGLIIGHAVKALST